MARSLKSIPELDGVRGLAIAMVLLYHFFYATMFPMFGAPPVAWQGGALALARGTSLLWAGVDLFLVLSGFLITAILLRARGAPDYYARFYRRRARRILPPYLAVLAVLALSGYPLVFLFSCLLFVTNLDPLFGISVPYLPLWSLSLEVQFYALWPWVVRRGGERALARLCLVVIVAVPLLRAWGFRHGANIHAYPWFRWDAFAWGGWLAAREFSGAVDWDRAARRLLAGALALSAIGAPCGLFDRAQLLGGVGVYSIFALGAAGLLAQALAWNARGRENALRWSPLRQLGVWSYEIFLIHPLVFVGGDALLARYGWQPWLGGDWLAWIALRAAVGITLSVIAARAVFAWVNRLNAVG